jgi:hypothetical protein
MYSKIFIDFDYDYVKLGNQLGEKWADYSWKNDSCPKYSYVISDHDWYDIWFDYKDPKLSEHVIQRLDGHMKQFTITDSVGDILIESDSWEEVKQFVLNKKVDEHYNNAQEKRATDVES